MADTVLELYHHHLLTFHGRYSDVFLFLASPKVFALTISSARFEREAARLLAKPKSYREIRCCRRRLHACIKNQTKSLLFHCRHPLARKNRELVGVHEGPQVIFTSAEDAGIVAEAWYLCTGTGSAVLSGCLPTQLQLALRIAKQGWTYNRRRWL